MIGSAWLQWFRKQREMFADPQKQQLDNAASAFASVLLLFSILLFIVEVACGCFAVYLSWMSNTLIEWETPWKVLFAFFAFFGNWSYLIWFLIMKVDMIAYVKHQKAKNMLIF